MKKSYFFVNCYEISGLKIYFVAFFLLFNKDASIILFKSSLTSRNNRLYFRGGQIFSPCARGEFDLKRYIAKRLAMVVLLLFGMSFIVFASLYITPRTRPRWLPVPLPPKQKSPMSGPAWVWISLLVQ